MIKVLKSVSNIHHRSGKLSLLKKFVCMMPVRNLNTQNILRSSTIIIVSHFVF